MRPSGAVVDRNGRKRLRSLLAATGAAVLLAVGATALGHEPVTAATAATPSVNPAAWTMGARWIAQLWPRLTGDAPAGADVVGWADRMAVGQSRSEVVQAMVDAAEQGAALRVDAAATVPLPAWNSTTAREARVRAAYEQVLARAPDPSGLAYWSSALQTMNDTDLMSALGASHELYQAAQASALPDDATPPGAVSGATLRLDDEFSGDQLGSAWTTCFPWVDAAKGCQVSTTGEQQWYVPQGVTVSGGQLHLTAHRATVTDSTGRSHPYWSGMVSTARADGVWPNWPSPKPASFNRFAFTGGFLEWRGRFPVGKGLWPGLWLLPTDERWPPEIDLMEAIGEPGRIHVTYHEPSGAQQATTVDGIDAGWHVFAVNRLTDVTTVYVDGAPVLSFREPEVLPMYVLADLAVGGHWPGSPDASTPFPSSFDLDWVHAWSTPIS